MAYTEFGTNDANTVKLWSKMVTAAEREYLEIKPLMGDTPNSVIYVKTDLSEKRGDRVTFNLRKRLTQDGKTEGERAEGNGESLSFFTDNLYINELLGIVGNSGVDSIDQQRVQFDLREQGKEGLGEWWAERMSVSFFNQVCGNVAISDTKYSGMNATIAPSSTRIIRPNGRTTDQSIDSNDPFTLDLIDRMVTKAKIGSNRVRPIKIGGKSKYIVYLHPAQVEDLRTNSASGQWQAIRQAAMQGGEITENDIYTGALGEHNSCILRESQDVTKGCNSSTSAAVDNTRRAVLLGAQSACMANKKYKNGELVKWNEEQFDHGREVEMTAFKVWGLKKVVYDSADFGTIVCTTYSDE
jgi:N4-gp56 family major capsid protein